MKLLFLLQIFFLIGCSHIDRRPANEAKELVQYEYPNPAVAVQTTSGTYTMQSRAMSCSLSPVEWHFKNIEYKSTSFNPANLGGVARSANFETCSVQMYTPEQIRFMFDNERMQNINFLDKEVSNLARDQDFIRELLSNSEFKQEIIKILKDEGVLK